MQFHESEKVYFVVAASIGLFLIVQDKGHAYISVDVEPSSNIDIDKKQLKVPHGDSKKVCKLVDCSKFFYHVACVVSYWKPMVRIL